MALALMISSGLTSFSATPVANPLVFGNNRLSIITPTLLRLEFADSAKFIDDPTLFAYDRTSMLSPEEITVKVGGGLYAAGLLARLNHGVLGCEYLDPPAVCLTVRFRRRLTGRQIPDAGN